MTFREIYDKYTTEINVIVAAERGLRWEFLAEDSKARLRDVIRDTVFALDGGREQFDGIEATVAEELRKLRDYRSPQNVKPEAPSEKPTAPTRRGK